MPLIVSGPVNAVGLSFHREVLAAMTSGDLFRRASGRSRTDPTVAWRRVCAMILRHNTSLSWPEIAMVMGRPNHSMPVTVARHAKPAEEWGPNAVYLCCLHHDAASRRDLPHTVEDWRWTEAWKDMKKEKA